ncbi:MAG TPA: sulfite exporter TauE/SafE family protein [Flavobacterium sp.]|jgi:hypothetical protein
MLEYIGYACAVVIGLVLGLMGGGGSILTVPVLVYLMGYSPVTAAAYSLFIVGTTSTFGTLKNIRNNQVEIRTGLIYAVPSLIGVFVARKFIVPAIPHMLFENAHIAITKDIFLMVLFAIVMFFSGVSMLRRKPEEDSSEQEDRSQILMLIKIFFAGILVGLVGAGGGFLFIPLLVYVAKLPIKKAIATSLLIIAINSLTGFTGDLDHTVINWIFLFTFTLFSIIGIFAGMFLNKFVNDTNLTKGFGIFVLLMAVFIFVNEVLI